MTPRRCGELIGGALLQDSQRTGLVFAMAGFALLSLGDVLVKSMAGLWPGSAIAALRYVIGAFGLGGILLLREGRAGFTFPRLRWQVLRGASVATAAISGMMAIHLMPISEATAISFTSPMLTALLAVPLLAEPLRRETLVASLVAFAGVLLILRPNFALLGPAALLPLVAATGMALLIIANRKVSGAGSALSMQFNVTAIASVFLVTAAIAGHCSGLPIFNVPAPPASVVLRCAVMAVSASVAHIFLYLATTRAGAGAVAPMTYVQLLLAGIFGWALFDEHPDFMAVLGACVIVGAGLYLWRSGRPARARVKS